MAKRLAVVKLWAGGTVEIPESEVTYRLRGDVQHYRQLLADEPARPRRSRQRRAGRRAPRIDGRA